MAGAAAAGFAGERGGEETAGAAGSRETAAGAPEDGSSTLAAGFIARESFSAPLRLPNTTALHTGGLLGPQLFEEGRQERTPRLFGFATAGQPLRDLQKHLGGAMIGGDFRDHLAIVCRRAEYLRVERKRRDRLAFNGLGEFAGVDFRPLRHPDLVETIERRPVVGPGCLEQVEYVLGVAEVGEIGRCDDQNVVRTDQRAPGPSGPLMRNVEHDARHRGAKRVEDRVEGIGAKIVDRLERRWRRQQAEVVGAFRQQAVDERSIDAIGREYRIRDPLRWILIVVEAAGAEPEVEICDDRVPRKIARDRPGDG